MRKRPYFCKQHSGRGKDEMEVQEQLTIRNQKIEK